MCVLRDLGFQIDHREEYNHGGGTLQKSAESRRGLLTKKTGTEPVTVKVPSPFFGRPESETAVIPHVCGGSLRRFFDKQRETGRVGRIEQNVIVPDPVVHLQR